MKRTLRQLILFIFTLLTIEIAFRIQSGTLQLNELLFRSLLYVSFLGLFLTLLNRSSRNKIVTVLTVFIMFFISTYAVFQISMKNYYGAFFSSRFLSSEMPNVGSYASDFINFIRPEYLIYPLVFIIFTLIYIKQRKRRLVNLKPKQFAVIFLTTVLFFLSYILMVTVDGKTYLEPSLKLLLNPYFTEASMNQLGLLSFIGSDLQYLVAPQRAVQKIETDPPVPKPPVVIQPVKDPLLREVDDTTWKMARESETNESFKLLDDYFMSQPITPKNAMTGEFEGKNLVFFLVEGFDNLAIHPDITPTLYKLKTEGIFFNHFHSPQFNCATAESELISVSGLYPVIGTCTFSNYHQNTNPQTLYRLFRQEGYTTRSFHNWTDEFYPRSVIHPSIGSELFKDESVTIPSRVSGWQSDLMMMETVVRDLNALDTQPFMSYVVTSSTHFPYDKPSFLGDKFTSQVKAVYPNAPHDIVRYLSKAKELDLSIQYLIDNLNSMDDTVLVLFSDHTPFKLQSKDIEAFTHQENIGQFYDSTPMIIYTPSIQEETITKVSSTIDLAPTIANLFDLDYDPRLFMGADLFSTEAPIVIMQSGSWRDQVGKYDVKTATFTRYDPATTHSSESIDAINTRVKQKIAISSQVYLEGYFRERPFLYPTK